MDGQRGGKIGWVGGWLGGSLWLLVATACCLLLGRIGWGLFALGCFLTAVASTFLLAPWKWPRVKFWKLFLPIYAVHMVAASVFLSLEGGPNAPRESLKLLGMLAYSAILPLVMGRWSWEEAVKSRTPRDPA